MGIRMLNRRPARAQASAEAAPAVPPAPVPVFAASASTARIPTDLATILRRTAADLRRRIAGAGEPPVWRLWAGLGRSHLAGLLARVRRVRPSRPVTVFVVTSGPFSDRPDGSAPR
jgi:hypothetical protein